MKNNYLILCINVMLLTLFVCCSESYEDYDKKAEALVSKYFNYIENKQVDSAMTLYSDPAFVKYPREEWRKLLDRAFNDSLGIFESYYINAVSTQKANMDKSSYTTSIACVVNYEKKEILKETFLILNVDNNVSIIGHIFHYSRLYYGINVSESYPEHLRKMHEKWLKENP